MKSHTINALPPNERHHALFSGCREGNYGFEVTRFGTLLVPENRMIRGPRLGVMQRGEDVRLMRDKGGVMVWRVE